MRAAGLRAALLVVGLSWAGAASGQSVAVTTRVTLPDGAAAAGVEVRAELHDGRGLTFSEAAVTDDSGTARWDAVPMNPGNVLRVAAMYAGVPYYSEATTSVDGGSGDLPVAVHPITSEGRPLHLDTLHLIIQVEEPGVYRVLQFMTVSNAGDAAFAGGPALADGRRAGLVIPLPEDATSLRAAPFPTLEQAIDLGDAEVGPDRILDPRPVPPQGRQVAITYDLLAGDDGVAVRLALPYPTASTTVLLGGVAAEGLAFTDSTLESRPPEQVGDQQYRMWGADTLQPGAEIGFRMGPESTGLGPQVWALIGLSAALLLAVGASLVGNGHANQEMLRQHLIAGVAAIDDRFASGDLDQGAYFALRAAEIEKLLLLTSTADKVD